jgi:hypothetical protein
MRALARSRHDRQSALAAGAGQVAIVRLALIRPGDRLDPQVQAAIGAWHAARRVPGAGHARCAVCGAARFAPAESVLTIALMLAGLDGALHIAAICHVCAALGDQELFAAMRGRLGGRAVDLSALSTAAGSA